MSASGTDVLIGRDIEPSGPSRGARFAKRGPSEAARAGARFDRPRGARGRCASGAHAARGALAPRELLTRRIHFHNTSPNPLGLRFLRRFRLARTVEGDRLAN